MSPWSAAVWILLGASCASSPPPTTARANAGAVPRDIGEASPPETFVERTSERMKREEKQRALDERRDEFLHRQNGRAGH